MSDKEKAFLDIRRDMRFCRKCPWFYVTENVLDSSDIEYKDIYQVVKSDPVKFKSLCCIAPHMRNFAKSSPLWDLYTLDGLDVIQKGKLFTMTDKEVFDKWEHRKIPCNCRMLPEYQMADWNNSNGRRNLDKCRNCRMFYVFYDTETMQEKEYVCMLETMGRGTPFVYGHSFNAMSKADFTSQLIPKDCPMEKENGDEQGGNMPQDTEKLGDLPEMP